MTRPVDEVSSEVLADDILWGAAAIGRFLGVDERRVYYLAERKQIPIKKIGHKTITASKRRLRELFRGDE